MVVELRKEFATGEYTLDFLLEEVMGWETRSRKRLSNLMRGYGEASIPASPFDKIRALYEDPDEGDQQVAYTVTALRIDHQSGQSIDKLAERYGLLPLHVRKILSGEIGKFLPGPLDKKLRKRPNPRDSRWIFSPEAAVQARAMTPTRGEGENEDE